MTPEADAQTGGSAAAGSTTLRFEFGSNSRCLLQPARAPRAAERAPLIVFLHGQGQSGERQQRWMGAAVPDHFAAAFPDGFLPYEIRKPGKPVRIGHGWYLYSADRPAFLASLREAVARVWQLVDRACEELGADPQRIWFAGFSQGAYLTHTTALHGLDRVQGWIGQAGAFRADYAPEPAPNASGKPVLLQHGTLDEALPLVQAEATADLLRSFGADVELATHEVKHVITPAMATEARAWLERHSARLSD
ncbi:MAG: phospholipase/carboxylesterase [Planctomycetota bacterium]|nr:MAG: phospholipase/carboxylesterase [Planctomycetota bacterium]